jgi:hypothetical protein
LNKAIAFRHLTRYRETEFPGARSQTGVWEQEEAKFGHGEGLRVMSHVPDMQALESGDIAVGWLHSDHPFSIGDSSPDFVEKLKEFANQCYASTTALGIGASGGYHACGLCGKAHCAALFGVPAGETLFLSPEMIAHYVEVHHYAPPVEFVKAVMASPLPGTLEYVKAISPFVERRNASTMKDAISIRLERHVALVLFEFLIRFSDADEFAAEERADQVAIWTLLGNLESILVEPFDPNYQELLKQAQRRVVNYGKDEPAE